MYENRTLTVQDDKRLVGSAGMEPHLTVAGRNKSNTVAAGRSRGPRPVARIADHDVDLACHRAGRMLKGGETGKQSI